MKDYKRITTKGNRIDNPIPLEEVNGNMIPLCDLYNRLAELEDKIENGTLIEIPCVRYDEDRKCWQAIYEQMGIITTCNCGSKEQAQAKSEEFAK